MESAGPDPSVGGRPRITFVNQHYAPDVASTGQHLADLAEYLAEHGWDVEVLTARGAYRSGRLDAPARERHNGVQVRRLWTPGLGRGRHVGRLLDYACFGAQALMRLLAGRSPDGIVFLTTPPLLPAFGRIVRSLRGTPYGVWSMDLHPEAEIAHQMLSAHGVLARLLLKITNLGYRGADFIVVLGSCMRRRLEDRGIDSEKLVEIPVWSRADEVHPVPRSENPLAQELGLDGHFVVGYSGNAGIAHDFGPILDAMKAMKDDAGTEFLFIGGGPRRPEIKAFAAANRITNLRYVDYVPREQLAYSLSLPDVHLVTLRPEFEGIAVPGKLYGIMAAGRPVMFVGPKRSATATTVEEAGCGMVVDPASDPAAAENVARILRHWRTNVDERRLSAQRGRRAFVTSFECDACCEAWYALTSCAWVSASHRLRVDFHQSGDRARHDPIASIRRRLPDSNGAANTQTRDSEKVGFPIAGEGRRLVGVTLLANLSMLGLGLVTGILTARLLGPEGRGALTAVFFWPQLIASLGILSVHDALVFRLGKGRTSPQRVAHAAFWLCLALAVVVGAVIWFSIPTLLGAQRKELWSISRIYAVGFIPFNFAWLVLLGIDQGTLRLRRYNLFRLLVPLSYAVLLLGLWLTGRFSVETAALASLAAVVLVGSGRLWLSRSALMGLPDWTELRALLRDGLGFHSATALLLISAQMDRLLGVRLFDDTTLGIYTVAFSLASVGLLALATTSHTVLFPALATAPSTAQGPLFARGIRGVMLVVFVAAGFVIVLAQPLVHVLYGSAYNASVLIVRVLAVGFAVVALKQTVVRSVRGLGEAKAGALTELATLALFLALGWPLAVNLGPLGLAGALCVSNLLPLAVLLTYLRRRLGLRMGDLWGFDRRTLKDVWRVVPFRAAILSR